MGRYFDEPLRWDALARELGLTPMFAAEPYQPGTSFRGAMGVLRRSHDKMHPSFEHWLVGRWRGLEVVLARFDARLFAESMSWSTAVLARIEPSLFMNLAVGDKKLLQGLTSRDLSIDPRVDSKLEVRAARPDAARVLLSPMNADDRALVDLLVAASAYGLRISDNEVVLEAQFSRMEASWIVSLLELATSLGHELSRRRSQMQKSEEELARSEQWCSFAEQHRLEFDPARMSLAGMIRRARVGIVLESEAGALYTAIIVHFSEPLPVNFTVRPTALPSVLQTVLADDIRIGQDEFDRAFLVTGAPKERVREILSKPALLAFLAELAPHLMGFDMDQDGISLRLPAGRGDAATLSQSVELASRVSEAFLEDAAALHPYR